ncbi:hypothetical protein L3V82_11535 [Thiotrichales bacterium 19S3-7]|nr:hypothetical protein [Thiotrichales bacterium 19S3-7]MCF6802845.1 hypothetical protein [Thiotrichales bacterium 19S3-11]
MSKRIFAFDLDETLFSCDEYTPSGEYILKLHSNILKYYAEKTKNYYPNMSTNFYALHKEAMKQIMHDILANGDEIAFITAGKIPKEQVKAFFRDIYEIELGDDFKFYSNQHNKSHALNQLIEDVENPKDIVFTDNRITHILDEAAPLGVTTVYADTNPPDQTSGRQHIEKLQKIIIDRQQEIQNISLIEKLLDYAKDKSYYGGGENIEFNGNKYLYVPKSVKDAILEIQPYLHIMSLDMLAFSLCEKLQKADKASNSWSNWGGLSSYTRDETITRLYKEPKSIIEQFKQEVLTVPQEKDNKVKEDLPKVIFYPQDSNKQNRDHFIFQSANSTPHCLKEISPSTSQFE